MKDNSLIKIKNNRNLIGGFCLILPSLMYIYLLLIPQYELKESDAYLAGVMVLSGCISFTVLCAYLKEKFSKKSFSFLFPLLGFISLGACVNLFVFYGVKKYILSLILFIFIQVLYSLLYILKNKAKDSKSGNDNSSDNTSKSLRIGYIGMMCLSGIISILSTVITGLHFVKMPVLIALLLIICVFGMETLLLYKTDYKPYFPWDVNGYAKEVKTLFKTNIKVAFAVIASLIVPYLLLGPLEIYAANMLSFSFGYLTFFPLFLMIGVLTIVIGGVAVSLLSNDTFKFVCISIITLSFLSYIQYLFMNTKLMEEDGSRLKLDTMGNYPVINLAIWAVACTTLFVIMYLLKDKWASVAMGLGGFLCVIQLVAVISLVVKCAGAPAPRYYQLTGEKQFTVAKDENVIILIPDTFSRPRLRELMEEDSENVKYLNILKDFTYYDNVDSEYFPTFPSVIHMFTGYDPYDGISAGLSEERVKWQSDAWNSEKCSLFFDKIQNAGYKVYMNTVTPCELVGAYDDVKDKIENVEYAESNVDKTKLIKLMLSMSTFRCVPYVIKPKFEVMSWSFSELEQYSGESSAYKNEDFYRRALEGITVDDSVSKKIQIIIWHGFHDGFSNDEFCNPVSEEEAMNIPIVQNTKAAFLCIDTYLNGLKNAGMYDNSTIIVMGDHGTSNELIEEDLHAPCFFIKLKGQSNDIYSENNIIDSKKTFSQIQATVLDVLGEDYSEFGKSILEE